MKPYRLYENLIKAIESSEIIPPCMNTDPEVWFGDREEGYHNTNAARKLCGMCPAKQACAEYAIAAPETHGVWGGLTPRERLSIRTRRYGEAA